MKGFGAVVDVLITASGENFKASEIVYFRSGSNFAAEVIVEKIVVHSAVDCEHGRARVSPSSSWASVTARCARWPGFCTRLPSERGALRQK